MIRKDFSRSFLRMGYDASEVLSFLVDIEHTITGEETDPKKVITAQKAEDQEFSVKWRGFMMKRSTWRLSAYSGVARP